MVTVLILAGIILGVVALDQLTKYLAVIWLDGAESVRFIPHVLHFTFVRNEGAAFGMLSNHRWVFMVFSTVAILALGVYLFRFCKENMWIRVSLAMVIGGGIGNMIDRIALGSVIDFLELPFLWLPVLNMYFPIFNVADSFVTVGCVILIVCLIRAEVREVKKEKAKKEMPTAQNFSKPEIEIIPEISGEINNPAPIESDGDAVDFEPGRAEEPKEDKSDA